MNFPKFIFGIKQHLEVLISEYDIVKITDEFKPLQIAYQSEVQTKASIMVSITKQVSSMDGGPSVIGFQHCVHIKEDWHLFFLELVL